MDIRAAWHVMKKLSLTLLVVLVGTALCINENKFTISFVAPQAILSGFSLVGFVTEPVELENIIGSSSEYGVSSPGFNVDINLSYINNQYSASLNTLIPQPNPFKEGDGSEEYSEGWFWSVSPSFSLPFINLDTFKIIGNFDYRFYYFRIIQFEEPAGIFEETFHYGGVGLTIALLGSDPELEKPDYYSWLFSQEIGYSWEGGLTGISSIRWSNTGLFESYDDSPFGSIGVEAVYSSSYVYLRYFLEFGWIL
jgi:hypothetical protein